MSVTRILAGLYRSSSMIRLVAALALFSIAASSADAANTNSLKAGLTVDGINAAGPETNDAAALITKAEVLLDRNHFSPGQIDGKNGENFRKALAAFQQTQKLDPTGKIDSDTWNALAPASSSPVLKRYTISEEDVAGPFERQVSRRLEQMAKLHGLSYTSPLEELSEKFHMSESLLRSLNPNTNFDRAGTSITVPDVGPMALHPTQHTIEVAPPKGEQNADTIVVDKPARQVRAYKDGKLLGVYPATVGSDEKPAPTGMFKVRRVAWNPDYHYDPKFRWKNVKTKQKLTIAPGPNNPVGLVWIDLTAPSYGIHGTPEPDTIGKTSSHGCIRLTNWDAVDLAAMAHPGTAVKFEDQDSPIVPLASK
jgi:lipoprotein-anchoring transpeptidase ErfK/SrfK